MSHHEELVLIIPLKLLLKPNMIRENIVKISTGSILCKLSIDAT